MKMGIQTFHITLDAPFVEMAESIKWHTYANILIIICIRRKNP